MPIWVSFRWQWQKNVPFVSQAQSSSFRDSASLHWAMEKYFLFNINLSRSPKTPRNFLLAVWIKQIYISFQSSNMNFINFLSSLEICWQSWRLSATRWNFNFADFSFSTFLFVNLWIIIKYKLGIKNKQWKSCNLCNSSRCESIRFTLFRGLWGSDGYANFLICLCKVRTFFGTFN